MLAKLQGDRALKFFICSVLCIFLKISSKEISFCKHKPQDSLGAIFGITSEICFCGFFFIWI